MSIETFSWISVVMSVIVFLCAVGDLVLSWKPRADTKAALKSAASLAKSQTETDPQGTLTEQSAPNFKATWEALASLATALKDLDRSSRLFVISLALLAVAGATLGLDSVSDAVRGAIR